MDKPKGQPHEWPQGYQQSQQQPVVQQQPAGVPGQFQWMPAPQAPTGCPPGLEYLLTVDQILIHQLVELTEAVNVSLHPGIQMDAAKCNAGGVPVMDMNPIQKGIEILKILLATDIGTRETSGLTGCLAHMAVFTGWETNNKYRICNSMSQQVYFAVEDTDCCTRQCCGPGRPFEMKIIDNMQREVIHLSRPFRCKCCWWPWCLQEIEIQSPPGTVIGYVEQKQTWWKPKLEIQDAQHQAIMMINGPCCPCSCGSDVKFPIHSLDGGGEIGMITKQWTGLVRELFADAANFGITFPLDLDIKYKAILIGAVFLVDFMFFERKN